MHFNYSQKDILKVMKAKIKRSGFAQTYAKILIHRMLMSKTKKCFVLERTKSMFLTLGVFQREVSVPEDTNGGGKWNLKCPRHEQKVDKLS